MKKISFLFSLILISLTSFQKSTPLSKSTKMNVLFIAVDDMNHWIGYFGRKHQKTIKRPKCGMEITRFNNL